jgi:hypothetical protein
MDWEVDKIKRRAPTGSFYYRTKFVPITPSLGTAVINNYNDLVDSVRGWGLYLRIFANLFGSGALEDVIWVVSGVAELAVIDSPSRPEPTKSWRRVTSPANPSVAPRGC